MPKKRAANNPSLTEESLAKQTPLMKQHEEVKLKYPEAIILFRVGDFYETFGEDAIKASKILNITLTKRSNGSASEIELAGFPYHALDNYMPRLIKAGHRVAICDQLESPKGIKGIVKRGVTQIVTPGLAYDDSILSHSSNNYLASIYFGKDEIGVSFLDISTGEFFVTQGDTVYIQKLVESFNPAETIFCKKQNKEFETIFGNQYTTFSLEEWAYQYEYATEILNEHFNTVTLKGFGIDKLQYGIVASGAVMRYLEETEHKNLEHIRSISRIEQELFVWMDSFTTQSLELVKSQREDGVSLLEVLDATTTPMGSRLLVKWLLFPLKDKTLITQRHSCVDAFLKNPTVHQTITSIVKQIGDLERLSAKVSVRRTSPREIVALSKSLFQIAPLKRQLMSIGTDCIDDLHEHLPDFNYLLNQINSTIQPSPPISTNQGHIIREGVNEELDQLREIASSGKKYLIQVQQEEIKKTGISSLKVAYNKVFGYYLEVTNTHKNKVPSTWIRKQTLANVERYVTEDLKNYEEKILTAEQQYILLEQQLFCELVAKVSEFVPQIQEAAKIVAQIDCYLSFAKLARQNNYCKPYIDDSNTINILAGRHPVIEQQMYLSGTYIPNDLYINPQDQQIIVITGPNMSGKSAMLRQTALIVIMAQIGSFVPAESASIGIVDKIFTRVGASDNIAKGESTFMTEMTETSSIMNNLSDKSLIIMDEIGRGTSTYDGISIAWAILEYLHNHKKFKPRTLFATHYHELNILAEQLERVKNFNISVKEIDKKILFLRKLQPGGSSHSFGIHVAELAGMPPVVVNRAYEILTHLESRGKDTYDKDRPSLPQPQNYQLSLIDADPEFAKIKYTIASLNLDTITPIEALLKLHELKNLLTKKRD